jgi:branched-chain amino acid transport system substrate-binding protein
LGGQAWPQESGLVSDFAPGHDSETYFKQTFSGAGGEVPLSLRVPLLNPDFAPFLQRVRDASPDGVFVFIPAGQAATMMRQFVERGLDKSGIRLFGAGDITDDDLLNNMGDVALGLETAYFYSAAHPSEKNKAFVEGVKRANNGMRQIFSVSQAMTACTLSMKPSEKRAARRTATASLPQ